jgi:hypothetical protein
MQRYRYLRSANQSPYIKKRCKCAVSTDDKDARYLGAISFFFVFQLGFSKDIPNLFGSVAELATGNTGTETVVADTDSFVLERVGKVIVALGHGTDEDGDTLVGVQRLQVVLGTDNGRLETHGHFAAVGGQVVGDRVLNNLEELFL